MRNATKQRERKDVSGWRRLARLLVWMLVILLLPVFSWWLYNRIDEKPSAAALRYATPAPRSVDDAANAWLHLYGIGAHPDEAPHQFGRRRLDAWTRRAAAEAQEASDLPAVPDETLPPVTPDFASHGTAEYCPADLVDCIDWARSHRRALALLQEASALHLERYAAVLELRDWRSLRREALDAPNPSLWTARLYHDLIARDLAEAFESGEVAAQADALDRLARNVEFWRRIPAQAGDLFSIVAASTLIEADQRLAGHALDRLAPAGSAESVPTIEKALDAIFQPLPSVVTWQEALGHEYRVFVQTLTAGLPGGWDTVRRCIAGSIEGGCMTRLAMDAAFVPQASFNLHAGSTEALQRWLEADAVDIDAASAAYSAAFHELMPNFEDFATILRQLSYNYAGRILVTTAVPRSDWALRMHDREALRRMLILKRRARSESVSQRDMADFLASQTDDLRNPYSVAPFEWDLLFGELRMAPKATVHWQRPALTVAASRAPTPAGVTACTQAFEFEIEDRFAEETPVTLHYGSCGLGNPPLRLAEAGVEESAADASEARLYLLDARRQGDEVGMRLIESAAGEVRRHEARLTFEESSGDFSPVGREGGVAFAARLLGPASGRWVSVNVTNQSAREFAEAIAAATGLRLDGRARLGSERITLSGDYPVEMALSWAGEIGGRRVRAVTPAHYVFE